jgi:hypothetical protein
MELRWNSHGSPWSHIIWSSIETAMGLRGVTLYGAPLTQSWISVEWHCMELHWNSHGSPYAYGLKARRSVETVTDLHDTRGVQVESWFETNSRSPRPPATVKWWFGSAVARVAHRRLHTFPAKCSKHQKWRLKHDLNSVEVNGSNECSSQRVWY